MKNIINVTCLFFLILSISCKKLVEANPPETSLIRSTVFTNDATATAAIIDIYALLDVGGSNSLAYTTALSADELDQYLANPTDDQFSKNNLLPDNSKLENIFWTLPYLRIFRANAVIEGLQQSNGVSTTVKNRLEGEAKFFRAFEHFYLLNLFGDIPLVTTTDYRLNALITRTPKEKIYEQIIKDLKDAQNLLSNNYLSASGVVTAERKRINKFSATALLSRVYLYTKDWTNAESEAGKIIDYKDLYSTEPIDKMFLKNAKEAIWQIGKDNMNTNEPGTYAGTPPIANAALKASFVQLFDSDDLRRKNWITEKIAGTTTYYSPSKYKNTALTPITEYYTVLRLGEQYLIRAEARAELGKIVGNNSAETDLNYIRNRAGLNNTTAVTQPEMLNAIMLERRFELFTEWGHRWLDLKRTNKADAVLEPLKGVNWQSTDQLYPIPQKQLLNDPAMADQQNPGYF